MHFHERSLLLTKSIVLLISHSGGTFSTLAVANLLKAVTPNLFAVTC